MMQEDRRIALLASDLDGTLIASPPTAENARALAELAEHLSEGAIPLVYVTGRHLALAEEGIDLGGLPRPDALACDVGTSIYWDRDGAFSPDSTYRTRVAATPGVATAADVRRALADVSGLTLQEEEKQADFKVSYHVEGMKGGAMTEEVTTRLDPVGRLRKVWSTDSATGQGLLDILPEAIGKRTAVEHVLGQLGVERSRVIFAGDSGNDRDALLAGWRAVVVGNAPAELEEELRSESLRLGLGDRVYFARGKVASGVLEGVRHFNAIDGGRGPGT